jgi:hypothetical protein
MNTLKNSFNGLASSLFLATGLTRIAERFDPVLEQADHGRVCKADAALSSEWCTVPCDFVPNAR